MNLEGKVSYRDIIVSKIHENRRSKAYKTQLARAASCSNSYISHVLKSKADLTLDQASALCDFWKMIPEEADHFINLVCYERARSDSLRSKLYRRLEPLNRQAEFRHFEKENDKITSVYFSNLFFSKWYHSAVLKMLSLHSAKSIENIAHRLKLPKFIVDSSLALFMRMNLAEKVNGEWHSTLASPILSRSDDPAIYHASWRQKALSDEHSKHVLSHSEIYAISQEDLVKVKNLIAELIFRGNELYRTSKKDDALVVLLVDLFTL